MFVVVTVASLWLGYYFNWKNERRIARAWLGTQVIGGAIGCTPKPPSAFPWMLKFLGDKPTQLILMKHQPTERFRSPIPDEYLALVRHVEELFPEAVVMDLTPQPHKN